MEFEKLTLNEWIDTLKSNQWYIGRQTGNTSLNMRIVGHDFKVANKIEASLGKERDSSLEFFLKTRRLQDPDGINNDYWIIAEPIPLTDVNEIISLI